MAVVYRAMSISSNPSVVNSPGSPVLVAIGRRLRVESLEEDEAVQPLTWCSTLTCILNYNHTVTWWWRCAKRLSWWGLVTWICAKRI